MVYIQKLNFVVVCDITLAPTPTNTKGVLPNCGRTPLLLKYNYLIFALFLTFSQLSDNMNP